MVNRSVRDGREQTHGLSLAGAVGGMARGRSAVNDLHAHLCGMRDGLIAKMAAQLEIGALRGRPIASIASARMAASLSVLTVIADEHLGGAVDVEGAEHELRTAPTGLAKS